MEIIPKKHSKPSKSLNILLYFSLFLLFFSITIFSIASYLNKRYQEEYINLEQVLERKIPQEEFKLLKEEISTYKEKLKDFSFLLNKQKQSSKVFTAIEEIVHPQVWFSEIDLDLKSKKVTLSGQAQNFEVLGQQFYIIKNQDWIKDINLKKVLINEERKIDFGLYFTFNINLLNKNEQI